MNCFLLCFGDQLKCLRREAAENGPRKFGGAFSVKRFFSDSSRPSNPSFIPTPPARSCGKWPACSEPVPEWGVTVAAAVKIACVEAIAAAVRQQRRALPPGRKIGDYERSAVVD
jgi:hypothetical protein